MIRFQRSLAMSHKPEAVWHTLGQFMHIDAFAPQITSVEPLTSGEGGVGSKRRNHFSNGTSLVEEVTVWSPGHGYTVELSDMGSMPLLAARSHVSIEELGDGCMVIWAFEFSPKYGPFGWLMSQTLMKPMMGKIIDGNLKGLDDIVKARQLEH